MKSLIARLVVHAAIIVACLTVAAGRAQADASVFVGAITGANTRPVVGGAFGRRLSPMFGFELELVKTIGDSTATKSSAGVFGANLVVQPSVSVHGVQFYGIAGMGLYGETFSTGHGSGEILARNIGGGAKISIAGPLNFVSATACSSSALPRTNLRT